MKRTALILLVAGALATPFFLGTGFAQGWGGMHGNAGHGYGMMNGGHMGSHMGQGHMMNGYWDNQQNIPEEYRLSEKQQKQIGEIRDTYYKEIQPLQNKIQSHRQKYAEIYRNNPKDAEALATQNQAIEELWDQIGTTSIEAQKQVNEVLTKDQLAYFGSGHHFLMGMNGYGGMMAGRGFSQNGCFGAVMSPQDSLSGRGWHGMMNQN